MGDLEHIIAMRLKALILITALLIAPAVRAVDPQPYTVHIESTGLNALDSALKASSQLQSLRTTAPAGPFALVGRAEADVERLQTVLESFGYYQSHVSVTIAGRALDDAGVREAIEALPAGSHAPVQITIETGPLYHWGASALRATSARPRAVRSLCRAVRPRWHRRCWPRGNACWTRSRKKAMHSPRSMSRSPTRMRTIRCWM